MSLMCPESMCLGDVYMPMYLMPMYLCDVYVPTYLCDVCVYMRVYVSTCLCVYVLSVAFAWRLLYDVVEGCYKNIGRIWLRGLELSPDNRLIKP